MNNVFEKEIPFLLKSSNLDFSEHSTFDGYRHTYWWNTHYSELLRSPSDWEKLFSKVVASKADYLAWVNEWKQAYKQLSVLIRKTKAGRVPSTDPYSMGHFQSQTEIGKNIARRMLKMRMQGKRISSKVRNEQNKNNVVSIERNNSVESLQNAS